MLGADARFGPASRDALRECRRGGRLIACEVVWAETGAFFPDAGAAEEALGTLGIDFAGNSEQSALLAARSWRSHRANRPARERVIADFLVAAHARRHADQLLTRDRGFYKSRFADLRIVEPDGADG